MLYRINVLKIFVKFTRKHLCGSPFATCNLMFSYEFNKTFQNTFIIKKLLLTALSCSNRGKYLVSQWSFLSQSCVAISAGQRKLMFSKRECPEISRNKYSHYPRGWSMPNPFVPRLPWNISTAKKIRVGFLSHFVVPLLTHYSPVLFFYWCFQGV